MTTRASADFAAAALIAAFTKMFEVHPAGRVETGADGSILLFSGATEPTFNLLVAAPERSDPAEVDRLAASAAKEGVPWTLVERGEPGTDLLAIAGRYDHLSSYPEPLMLCPRADARLRGPRPPEVPVIRTITSAERQLHAEVFERSFDMPAETYLALVSASMMDASWATTYVAEVDGVPVATAYSARTGDAVGIFSVGVVPGFRGRGYGRLITERAMTDAFGHGATAAFLQASEPGLPLYLSMGFRTVETWTYLT